MEQTAIVIPFYISQVLFGLSLGLGVWLLSYFANRAWCTFWSMLN